MGGLLPGVDVESQRPKILKTSGLIDGAHQRPNLRRDAKIKRIVFRKQNEILRYYEILDEKESLLREGTTWYSFEMNKKKNLHSTY